MPFTLVSAEGRTLRLEAQAGGPPCDALLRPTVRETPTTVTITVRAGATEGADCGSTSTAMLGTFPLEVKLREPLGSRTLIDGTP